MKDHSTVFNRLDRPASRRPGFGRRDGSGAAMADATSDRTARQRFEAKSRLGWGRILKNVYYETNRDNVSVMAAGVAFWTFLSIFPGLSALISIYGLIADPGVIATQVASLSGILPQSTLELVYDQLNRLISAPRQALGFGLFVSLLLALWYSMSGTGTLMQALNVAYEERDTRGILAYYAGSAALTIGIGLFGMLSLFLVAIVPAVLDWLPFPKGWRDTIGLVRWPILAMLMMLGLGVVYRFAPARRNPSWHLFSPGTIVAATAWLAVSAGFSYYVAKFSSYDKTYGSLGTVVVLLMWLYLSSYIVLVGAELNSEIEQTRAGRRKQGPGAEPASTGARAS
jgi:membrane protein